MNAVRDWLWFLRLSLTFVIDEHAICISSFLRGLFLRLYAFSNPEKPDHMLSAMNYSSLYTFSESCRVKPHVFPRYLHLLSAGSCSGSQLKGGGGMQSVWDAQGPIEGSHRWGIPSSSWAGFLIKSMEQLVRSVASILCSQPLSTTQPFWLFLYYCCSGKERSLLSSIAHGCACQLLIHYAVN